MKNYVQPGQHIDIVAPAGVSSGEAILVGDLFGVCMADAASGESVVLVTEGVFELPKETGVAFAQGEKVYWDAGTKKIDGDSGNPHVGYAVAAELSAATSVKVKLA